MKTDFSTQATDQELFEGMGGKGDNLQTDVNI